MIQTNKVFDKNLEAYNKGSRIIINKGGTRSSKTYNTLILLFIICFYSQKPLIVSVVSYALPHLKLGAIRSLEKIMVQFGVNPASLKNISESTFKINKSIIEFFGVENLAKVHGPERDILFINEGNFIKSYDVVRHLMVRTRKTVFIDYNPSRIFWADDEIIGKKPCEVIHSTYLDNNFLSLEQVQEIESNKHNKNWWKVYGEGLPGILEDAIFTNWELGEFDETLPYGYGLDFGVRDPDAMIKGAVDKRNKRIYLKQEIYERGNSTERLYDLIQSREVGSKMVVADNASPRTIIDLRSRGLNIVPAYNKQVVEDIKMMRSYDLIIDPYSHDLVRELTDYVWLDKRGEIPIDEGNHLIDASRYFAKSVIKPRTSKGHKVL